MKQVKAISLLLAAVLSLTACGSSMQAADMTKDINPQTVSAEEPDEQFCKAQTAFALSLMQKAVSSDAQSNLLLSPYSVMQALAMTANGADGETRTQMEDALGGLPLDSLNPYLYAMRMRQPNDKNCKLLSANSIWIRDDADRIQVKPDFLQINTDYFGANAYKAPFDGSTAENINQWCSDHTDGMIPKVLDSINTDAVMYLINAVLFDAKWASPYRNEPYDRIFTAQDGTEQTAQMMYSDESCYLESKHMTGFIKPYKGGQYAFAALLPDYGMSAADCLAELTPDALRKILQDQESCDVDAGIPVFSYDYDIELTGILQTMGMQLAFSGNADFSRMADTASEILFIGSVLHKTHIDVDTHGTKAAAVTSVEMQNNGAEPSKHVILDRPFIYMILDTEKNLPVFVGILNELPDN